MDYFILTLLSWLHNSINGFKSDGKLRNLLKVKLGPSFFKKNWSFSK